MLDNKISIKGSHVLLNVRNDTNINKKANICNCDKW